MGIKIRPPFMLCIRRCLCHTHLLYIYWRYINLYKPGARGVSWRYIVTYIFDYYYIVVCVPMFVTRYELRKTEICVVKINIEFSDICTKKKRRKDTPLKYKHIYVNMYMRFSIHGVKKGFEYVFFSQVKYVRTACADKTCGHIGVRTKIYLFLSLSISLA